MGEISLMGDEEAKLKINAQKLITQRSKVHSLSGTNALKTLSVITLRFGHSLLLRDF